MADQSKIHVMDAWINYSKFYTRISKAMNYLLLEQHQLGLNDFYFLYFLSEAKKQRITAIGIAKLSSAKSECPVKNGHKAARLQRVNNH